jgi:hypothetical protein
VVPTQNGVRGDDGADASENAATEDLAFGCESTALVIGESKASATELLLQHAILFDEVINDLPLMAVDPASERGEEELEWEKFGHCTRIIG